MFYTFPLISIGNTSECDTHLVITIKEIEHDERPYDLDIIEGSASFMMRKREDGKWDCTTVERWSEVGIRLYEIQPKNWRAKRHPVDRCN